MVLDVRSQDAASKGRLTAMDFDDTIEHLNALKLHENGSNINANQHAEHAVQPHYELRRLQEENEHRVLDQERQKQRWQQEMREMQTRLEATEHQNHLLKAALGEVDTYRHQAETQQLVIEDLQTQVKQLRILNYRLQYVVQQSELRGGQGSFLPPPPPDIF